MNEYKIFEIAPLSNNLMLDCLIAIFYDIDLAKEYVNYQFTLGNHYGIMHEGVVIDLDEF